jgi:hypothetical protein
VVEDALGIQHIEGDDEEDTSDESEGEGRCVCVCDISIESSPSPSHTHIHTHTHTHTDDQDSTVAREEERQILSHLLPKGFTEKQVLHAVRVLRKKYV